YSLPTCIRYVTACPFSFFHCRCPHRDLHSFPTRRSSDLSGSTFTLYLPQTYVGPSVSAVSVTDSPSASISPQPGSFLSVRVPERSEEHTSELQSRRDLVCRLLLEKKK